MLKEIAALFNKICQGEYKLLVVDKEGKPVENLDLLVGESNVSLDHAFASTIQVYLNAQAAEKMLGKQKKKPFDLCKNDLLWEVNSTDKIQ